MEYNFSEVEKKWREYWAANETYKAENGGGKPPYYVLDMFPYPSGSGLHVGHPLGYIASDIHARYKRLKGFNVLHPMGYDAFGLPAEQYAIQTGQHPAETTEVNIKRYREQLDLIGFSFDWSREVRTSDPKFYKWTQWIFIQLFEYWFDNDQQKARPITDLVSAFASNGNENTNAACDTQEAFSSTDWNSFSEKEQQEILLNYRLAYLAEKQVNWCPALGTVLANDEVINGRSERGNHEVVQRKMKQWSLRITAYAQRLLDGLDTLDWTDSLKEVQRNWIGRSEGAQLRFAIENHDSKIEVFTTRIDTIFGATFMVLAPEHELVNQITTAAQKTEVEKYLEYVSTRSELDRKAETKTVTGAFTGAYAINPFTGKQIPIWTSEYVLAGYGTGAVMAVPAGDQRDYDFAKKFDLEIISIIEGQDISEAAHDVKSGKMINSEFLNGLEVKAAIALMLDKVEEMKIGQRQINFKMRDATFSRQRYWGEPFPIYYKDGMPQAMLESDLPLELPKIDEYKPTEDGDPPLGRADNWEHDGHTIELSTMPGYAGSSWYYLRYMDPHNENEPVSKEAAEYWGNVDLYMGGAEHSTGHLLYFRFWTMFLYDLSKLPFQEPAQKLINQGMIAGEDGQKMSKRYGNVINPDDVIAEHGADALRLHEMFLGPIEMHKPWNTKGIDGVSRFLRKLWRLYHNDHIVNISEEKATAEELKALHKVIKKVTEDMNGFSFNTSVSAFMVAVNELGDLKCNKREILEPLTVLVSCHAPYIAEELWARLGHSKSITEAEWPIFNPDLLVEKSFDYPVSFNGKVRFKLSLPLDMDKVAVEKEVMAQPRTQKQLEGKSPKKVIVVPGRIVNVVV